MGYRFTADSNVCMKFNFNMGLYLHIDLLSVSTWIPSSFRPVANLQVTERHLLLDRGQLVTPHGQLFCMCVVSDGGHMTFDGALLPVPHGGYGPGQLHVSQWIPYCDPPTIQGAYLRLTQPVLAV